MGKFKMFTISEFGEVGAVTASDDIKNKGHNVIILSIDHPKFNTFDLITSELKKENREPFADKSLLDMPMDVRMFCHNISKDLESMGVNISALDVAFSLWHVKLFKLKRYVERQDGSMKSADIEFTLVPFCRKDLVFTHHLSIQMEQPLKAYREDSTLIDGPVHMLFQKPMGIAVRCYSESENLPLYATEHAAAVDLFAKIEGPIAIKPQTTVVIPTGLYMEIPNGFELDIRSRSGLSAKDIVVRNSPATIDADYRGEIKVILHNGSKKHFEVNPGDRIAQALLLPVHRIVWERVSSKEELSKTERGEGGLGSTGVAR